MWAFFDGWRRKVGCVALVLALSVCGAWIRSFFVTAEVTIRTGDITHLSIRSTPGGIRFDELQQIDPYILEQGTFTNPIVTIPYSSIFVGLACLSACLLLWKPRKQQSPN